MRERILCPEFGLLVGIWGFGAVVDDARFLEVAE